MAMVMVVLGFAALFSDLGINGAYIQRLEVTQEQRSGLYWFNVLLSLGVTLLVIALSPLLAGLFGDARLEPLIMLSATTFVLGALGQQLRMSAEKTLAFRPLVLVEASATILGFASAVLAAVNGWGVYSLVVAGIVTSTTGSLLAWVYLARGWRPMWRLKLEDIRPFLGFGGTLVANNICSQVNSSLDVFLGGRLLGATQIGFYSVPRNLALQIQMIVNPIITRIGFPLIAQVQSDVTRVKSIYLKTINMTASTNAPLYIGVAFFAPDAVAMLLGSGWERSGELLRLLAIWGAIRSLVNPVGSLLLGMGRAGLAFKWNLALLLIMPPAMWFGSQGGPEGLAWALVILQISLFIPAWYLLVRPLCHATLREYSVLAIRPFVLSMLAVAPSHWITTHLDDAGVRLAAGIVLAAPLYIAISAKANREWFMAMLELLDRRRAVSAPLR
jgi:O-antigen/teichoic acid export membrane protein